ncbi:MAG: beta-lactamase family protein [Anaerolineae bacterium]|nr:beta-lactamase family protein [Anaerolineae bacterium]
MQINTWPTTGWQTINPAAANCRAEKLAELDAIIPSAYNNINGIVIVRGGAIIFERYYHDCNAYQPQHVASVTKSVLSALIGLSIGGGFIKNVDQSVLDFFPEYTASVDTPQKREVKLRHLLTMTAPYPFKDWAEPLDQLCMQPDWAQYILEGLGQNGRIGDFKYSTGGAHLLSAILTRSTGLSARAFANEYLFKPIGMREIEDNKMEGFGFEDLFGAKVRGWVKDPQGNSTGGWGLTLTARDMARFGLLYLNDGRWQGQTLLAENWVRESMAPNVHHYGYLWWLREDAGFPAYLALGDGGNLIACIPDKGLVVAITSFFVPKPKERWTLIKDFILPALLD